MIDVLPKKSPQATRDGRSSSAIAEDDINPACLSTGRLAARHFVKTAHILILLGFFLCGCSTQKAKVQPAIHFVKAGDTSWNQGGFILHVAKRHGNSLEGIRLVMRSTQGDEVTWLADTGTVSSGSFTVAHPGYSSGTSFPGMIMDSSAYFVNVPDENAVTITLFKPQVIGKEQHGVNAEMFILRRFPQPDKALEPTATAR